MWFPWHVVYKLISVLVYKDSSCLSGSSLSTGGAECHCCCDPVCSPQIRIPYWPSYPVCLVNWYVCRTQLCHLLSMFASDIRFYFSLPSFFRWLPSYLGRDGISWLRRTGKKAVLFPFSYEHVAQNFEDFMKICLLSRHFILVIILHFALDKFQQVSLLI